MIRTVLDMQVREGCAAAFERTWRDAAAVASRYPGAVSQTMLRSPKSPLHYTITADWQTHEDLAGYQGSQDRQALSATLDQLRESATKTLLEVVAHVGATAGTQEGTVRT